MTYEDERESDFLTDLYLGYSGGLENTTCALLASDGRTRLSGSGRGPLGVLDSLREAGGCGGRSGSTTERFADLLRSAAGRWRGAASLAALPRLANLRLGLNVAACEDQPLVVVHARNAAVRAELERRVSVQAWSDEFRGRFQYVVVRHADLGPLGDLAEKAGVLVVQADTFGLEGEVLSSAGAGAGEEALRAVLRVGLRAYDREVLPRPAHRRLGRAEGKAW